MLGSGGPPSLNDSERVILELLVERGETYGLELVKASGGRLLRGVVYVKLNAMQDRGLVSSRMEEVSAEPDSFPVRRLYKATSRGRQALEASL